MFDSIKPYLKKQKEISSSLSKISFNKLTKLNLLQNIFKTWFLNLTTFKLTTMNYKSRLLKTLFIISCFLTAHLSLAQNHSIVISSDTAKPIDIQNFVTYEHGNSYANTYLTPLGLVGFHQSTFLDKHFLKEDPKCGSFAAKIFNKPLNQKDHDSFKAIKEKAMKGDVESQCKMIFVSGVQYHGEDMIGWIKKATKNNHPLAQILTANQYIVGGSLIARKNGFDWSKKEQHRLLNQACDNNYAYGCYLLARLSDDNEKSISILKKSYKKTKSPSLLLYLGFYLSLVEKEDPAEKIFNKISQKYPSLLSSVVNYYLFQKQDQVTALKWVKKGLEIKDPQTQIQYYSYLMTQGEEKEALEYLKEAARKNTYALTLLAYTLIRENEESNKAKIESLLRHGFKKNKYIYYDIYQLLNKEALSIETLKEIISYGSKNNDDYSLHLSSVFDTQSNNYEDYNKKMEQLTANNYPPALHFAYIQSLEGTLTIKKEKSIGFLARCLKALYPDCSLEHAKNLRQSDTIENNLLASNYYLGISFILGNKESSINLAHAFSEQKNEQDSLHFLSVYLSNQKSIDMTHLLNVYKIYVNLEQYDEAIEYLEEFKEHLNTSPDVGDDIDVSHWLKLIDEGLDQVKKIKSTSTNQNEGLE